MRQHLRFALRTLIGPWLIIPALGIEVANFFMRGMPWRGEGLWTVDWFAISLFILGPVSAGVAAVDAARLSRAGNVHLAISVRRPGLAYFHAALWCAAPLIILHLLVISAALLVGQVGQPSVSWWSLLGGVAVQCLAIAWYVCLGSAIGRFSTPVVAGLAGGVAAFLLSYVIGGAFTGGPSFQLMKLGGATITMIGKSFNAGYLAAQAAILLATAVVLLAVKMRPRSGLRLPSPVATLALFGVAAVVAIAPSVLPAERYVATPAAPTWCVGAAPEVCLYHEHRRYATIVLEPIETLVQAAKVHGYQALVPHRIVEESRTYRPAGPDVLPLYLPTQVYEEGHFPLRELASALLTPSHCPLLQDPWRDPVAMEQFTVSYFSLLTTWLGLAGVEEVMAPVPTRQLSPDEVDTLLGDFGACRLDRRL